MNIKHYLNTTVEALTAAVCALALVSSSFLFLEPQIGQAQSNISTFTISQVVSDEVSFLVPATNVGMVGTLNGLTGGTANGSTTVVVRTNAPDGYTMTIKFATTSYSHAVMVGRDTDSDAIRNYPATSSQPTYAFDTSSSSAVFGYTVGAPSPYDADLDQSFKHDSSANCNEDGGSTANSATTCWMEPLLSNFTLVNRGSSATVGATSTLYFRVHVPNSPVPGVVSDTYIATATLTALTNP